MEVRYDKKNDFFAVGGKQVYWSSIYTLRQKSTTFKALCKKLKVSKGEIPLFREELGDLRALGFIRGKNKISVTKKGKEFLHEVERLISFRNLREKGVEDIDEAYGEEKKLYTIDLSKTKLLVKRIPFHAERVDWFPLFVNSTIGFLAFLVVLYLAWFAFMKTTPPDTLVIQLVMAPVIAIIFIGTAIVFLGLLYEAGKGISYFLFRRK